MIRHRSARSVPSALVALLGLLGAGVALAVGAPPAAAGFTCTVSQVTDTIGFAFPFAPSLTEDGGRVAFTSGKNLDGGNADGTREAFIADLVTPGIDQVTANTTGNVNEPQLDADGSHLLYTGNVDPTGGNADGSTEAFLTTVPGGVVTQLTSTGAAGTVFNVRLDEDADLVTVASGVDLIGNNADGKLEVFTVDPTGPTVTQVTSTTSGVGVSIGVPNAAGTELVVVSDKDLETDPNGGFGAADLFRHVLGGGFTTLTDSPGLAGGVENADADDTFDRVVYNSTGDLAGDNADGNQEIFQITSEGISQLTDTTGGDVGSLNPVISDDGQVVAFLSDLDPVAQNVDGNVELFVRSAEGVVSQVTETTGADLATSDLAIDGDGSRLAFQTTQDLTGGNADGNLELFTADCPVPEAPTCDGQPVTVLLGNGESPTAGPDVILGTAGPDSVNALGGADRFCGLGGNDVFDGGPGNDRAFGGSGADTLRGRDGADRLIAGSGNDRVVGGNQADVLQGQGGNDTLEGGNGNDALNGGPNRDTCKGQPGRDTAVACEIRTGIP